MSNTPAFQRRIALLLALASLIALLMAAYLYFQPMTGVTGSTGALLTLVGAGAALITCLLLLVLPGHGVLRRLLVGLLVLGAILTAVAGWFLLSPTITFAMAVVTLGALALQAMPHLEVPS